jgi:hypothetical protein
MKKADSLFFGLLMVGSVCGTVLGMSDMKDNSGLPKNFCEQLPQGMQRCLVEAKSRNFDTAAKNLVAVVVTWPLIRQKCTFVAGDLNEGSVSKKIAAFVSSCSLEQLAEVFFFDYMGTEDYKRAEQRKTKGKIYRDFDDWFDHGHSVLRTIDKSITMQPALRAVVVDTVK